MDIYRLSLDGERSLKVNLRFAGSFIRKTGGNKIQFELPPSTTLAEAIKRIFKTYKLGYLEVGENGINTGSLRIYLNGKVAPMNTILKENDEISFLPPIAGGYKQVKFNKY